METDQDTRQRKETDTYGLFDIDGTLIEYTPRLEEHIFMEGITPKLLREKNKTFTRIVLITNQNSTNEKSKQRQLGLVRQLREILPVDIYWLNSKYYRKPLPSILQHLEYIWTNNQIVYVGDAETDFSFCYNANIWLKHTYPDSDRQIRFIHRNNYFTDNKITKEYPIKRMIDYPVCESSIENQLPFNSARKTAYIMVGLPGTGKSYFANRIKLYLDKIGVTSTLYNGDGKDAIPPSELPRILDKKTLSTHLILDYTNGTDSRNALVTKLIRLGYEVIIVNVRTSATFNELLLQHRIYTQPETPILSDIALRTIKKRFSYYDLDVNNLEDARNTEKITVVNYNANCRYPSQDGDAINTTNIAQLFTI